MVLHMTHIDGWCLRVTVIIYATVLVNPMKSDKAFHSSTANRQVLLIFRWRIKRLTQIRIQKQLIRIETRRFLVLYSSWLSGLWSLKRCFHTFPRRLSSQHGLVWSILNLKYISYWIQWGCRWFILSEWVIERQLRNNTF